MQAWRGRLLALVTRLNMIFCREIQVPVVVVIHREKAIHVALQFHRA